MAISVAARDVILDSLCIGPAWGSHLWFPTRGPVEDEGEPPCFMA
jgi:hypothetical protein